MSDPEKPQWKPDLRRKVHRDAKQFGLRVIYDAFDNPAEHISDLMIWTGCSDAFVAELHDLIDGEAEALRDEIEGIRDAIAEDKS